MANAPTWDGPHFDVDHDELARIKAAGSHSHNDTLAYGEPLSSEDLAALYLKVAEAGHRDDSAVFAEEVRRQMIRPMAQQVFSDCAPTYATSHRWNWPDENGVMRCSCGAKIGVLDGLACVVHSPAIAIERVGFLSQEERNTIASNFLDEEQEHLQGRWRIALGLGWIEYVPAPTEQERCERLGVAWVGPDVQAYDAPLGEGGRIGGHVWALRIQVSSEHRDAVEEAIMCGQGRIVTHSAHKAHGGIVRLGLELREADGVRAR